MATRTIKIWPVNESVTEQEITAALGDAVSIRQFRVNQEVYVQFENEDQLQVLEFTNPDFKMPQLNDANYDLVSSDFSWNKLVSSQSIVECKDVKNEKQANEEVINLTEPSPLNLLTISGCDQKILDQLSEQELKTEIFSKFLINRILKKNKKIIIEFENSSETEKIEGVFPDLKVPRLGKNAVFDLDDDQNQPNFGQLWIQQYNKQLIKVESKKVLHEEIIPKLNKITSMEANFNKTEAQEAKKQEHYIDIVEKSTEYLVTNEHLEDQTQQIIITAEEQEPMFILEDENEKAEKKRRKIQEHQRLERQRQEQRQRKEAEQLQKRRRQKERAEELQRQRKEVEQLQKRRRQTERAEELQRQRKLQQLEKQRKEKEQAEELQRQRKIKEAEEAEIKRKEKETLEQNERKRKQNQQLQKKKKQEDERQAKLVQELQKQRRQKEKAYQLQVLRKQKQRVEQLERERKKAQQNENQAREKERAEQAERKIRQQIEKNEIAKKQKEAQLELEKAMKDKKQKEEKQRVLKQQVEAAERQKQKKQLERAQRQRKQKQNRDSQKARVQKQERDKKERERVQRQRAQKNKQNNSSTIEDHIAQNTNQFFDAKNKEQSKNATLFWIIVVILVLLSLII